MRYTYDDGARAARTHTYYNIYVYIHTRARTRIKGETARRRKTIRAPREGGFDVSGPWNGGEGMAGKTFGSVFGKSDAYCRNS